MDEIWCTGRSIIYGDELTSEYVAQQLVPQNILTCKRCPQKKGC